MVKSALALPVKVRVTDTAGRAGLVECLIKQKVIYSSLVRQGSNKGKQMRTGKNSKTERQSLEKAQGAQENTGSKAQCGNEPQVKTIAGGKQGANPGESREEMNLIQEANTGNSQTD